MVGKKKTNSLQGKKYCESCNKDISTSYFSKHLKTIGHLRNVDKNPVPPQKSSDESSASASVSSEDELKLDKIISSSEESEQEQEQPVDEEKDTSQSEQESEEEEQSKSEEEEEESEEEEEPTPEPSPEPVKKSKKVKKNVKVKVERQKPKPKKAGLYALSSSEEEPDQSVNPSGFLKFVNTLNNDFDITEADDIKKVFNSVMGFGKASYHINPSVKNQLTRYLNKYERDNSHLDEDTVHNYLTEFLSNY